MCASGCPYPGTRLAGLFFIPDSYDLTAFLFLVAAHQERAVPWAGATSAAGSKGPPACAEGQNGLKPESFGDLCQAYLASECCVLCGFIVLFNLSVLGLVPVKWS